MVATTVPSSRIVNTGVGSATGARLVRAVAFRAVQAALLPAATAGYAFWIASMIRYRKLSGASATVLATVYSRWMQHQLGTRRDEPCARLMAVLPNAPPLALWLCTAPTLLGHRLTRFIPRIYRYPYEGVPVMGHHPSARTTFFDAALARHIGSVEQLVVLGAGLDTRAYRLPASSRVRCFEVDTPKTQAFKRAMLHEAGVTGAAVTYVEADFLTEDWLQKLVAAGFDPDRPSFFLWESVCMYLDREAVLKTLRTIAGVLRGGALGFDYLSRELIDDTSLAMRYARFFLRQLHEPWIFGLESTPPGDSQISALLEACGLSLSEHQLVWQSPRREQVAAGFVVASGRAASAPA
jgi:methyltransferase (TIGR00027 family)